MATTILPAEKDPMGAAISHRVFFCRKNKTLTAYEYSLLSLKKMKFPSRNYSGAFKRCLYWNVPHCK